MNIVDDFFDEKVVAESKSSIEKFGFTCIEDAIPNDLSENLLREALEKSGDAKRVVKHDNPAMDFYVADLGPFARDFFKRIDVKNLIEQIFEGPFEFVEDRSSVTYYIEGSFLGKHKDSIVGEDCFSVILVVYSSDEGCHPQNSGLQLQLFGNGPYPTKQPLSRIISRSGSIVAGRGNEYWHERPRLLAGEEVIVVAGSFRTAN